MKFTHNNRLAAWACLLSAVLTVPVVVLAFATGIAEGLFETGLLSALFSLVEFFITLVSIYILVVLKNYLASSKTTWVLWSLIGVSLLYACFSLYTFLFPEVENIITLIELVLVIPIGILSIVLGVMILKIHTDKGNNLKGFAMINIAIGIACISVIFLIIVPLLSIISDIILAIVFSKSGQTTDTPSHSVKSIKKVEIKSSLQETSMGFNGGLGLVSVVFFVLFASLLIDIYQLLNLYDIYALTFSKHDRTISLVLALLSFVKITLIYGLLKQQNIHQDLILWLKFLLLVSVLFVFQSAFSYYFPVRTSLLSWLSVNYLLINGSAFILNFLLAIVCFKVAMTLKESVLSLNGFKNALVIGLFTYALFLALYFFDTLKLTSRFFVDLVLIFLFVSYYFSRLNFNLSRNKLFEKAFVGIVLFGPVFLFSGHFLVKSAGFLSENADWIAETGTELLEMETTQMETTHMEADGTMPNNIKSYQMVATTPVFNSIWLLTEKDWLGITATHLYKTFDGGRTWSMVKALAYTGEDMQFDPSGTRGWIGDRLNGIEITEDGGATWRSIEPEKIYTEVLGRKYRESVIANWSDMYLNPVTGKGGFTLKCKYFYTDDFANSWKNIPVINKEGDRICVYASPFAINDDNNLAMTGNMLIYNLYRKKDGDNYWEKVCNLDNEFLISDPCDENQSLTDEEKLFIQRYKEEKKYFSEAYIETTVVQQIMNDPYFPISQFSGNPHQQENIAWYFDSHTFIYSHNKGRYWQVAQQLKQFSLMVPVNQDRAYAWSDQEGVQLTSDGGRSWEPLFPRAGYLSLHAIYSDKTKKLWVLFKSKLISIDVLTGDVATHLNLNNDIFDKIGSSADGQTLWVYRSGYPRAYISFDSGANWVDFNTYAIAKNAADYWSILSISQITCQNSQSFCHVVRSDGSVIKVLFKDNELFINSDERFILPKDTDGDEDDEPGWLVISVDDTRYIYIPKTETRYVYSSTDKGVTWEKTSVKTRQQWSMPEYSGNGSSIILRGEDKAVVTHDSGKSWITISPSDWGDQIEYCWGHDGQTMVVSDHNNLAISEDGGLNWVRLPENSHSNAACGIANGYLWMLHNHLSIYERKTDETNEKNRF